MMIATTSGQYRLSMTLRVVGARTGESDGAAMRRVISLPYIAARGRIVAGAATKVVRDEFRDP
jgi:hypothetical protein